MCDSVGTDQCVSNQQGEARCLCKSGYEGDLCDQTWEDKYEGTFDKTEICPSLTRTFAVGVETGPNPGQITISNFSNQAGSQTTAKVVANLLGSKVFDIYEQFMTFGKVVGSGSLGNDDKIRLTYTIDSVQCNAILERR